MEENVRKWVNFTRKMLTFCRFLAKMVKNGKKSRYFTWKLVENEVICGDFGRNWRKMGGFCWKKVEIWGKIGNFGLEKFSWKKLDTYVGDGLLGTL